MRDVRWMWVAVSMIVTACGEAEGVDAGSDATSMDAAQPDAANAEGDAAPDEDAAESEDAGLDDGDLDAGLDSGLDANDLDANEPVDAGVDAWHGDAWHGDAWEPDLDMDGVPASLDCDDDSRFITSTLVRPCVHPCGGVSSRSCTDGVWTECSMPATCRCTTPGAFRASGGCGNGCARQRQRCSDEGVWVGAGACSPHSGCVPGSLIETWTRTTNGCGDELLQRAICGPGCGPEIIDTDPPETCIRGYGCNRYQATWCDNQCRTQSCSDGGF